LIPHRKFLYEARKYEEEMNTSNYMVRYHRKKHVNPGDQGQEDKVLDANQLRSIVGTITESDKKKSLRDHILSPLMGEFNEMGTVWKQHIVTSAWTDRGKPEHVMNLEH
jgi:hypothetical protein